ncbi:response regulator [Luteimonas marina]|uniref:Response regulator n=1 Tax=Luteimonas marina TaxID=488485 RepID=A0A5C5U4L2_9GAMM|nr:response regulator [Luteimonas marina]
MLVEDDPTSRAFLQAATEALPAEVDVAGSMAEATTLAARHAHALWLIDANLPDGTGAALLARLRARRLTTPAIAHTASHERGEHDALMAAGFVATVAKPLSAEAWMAAIRLALDGTPWASPARSAIAGEATVDLYGIPTWDDDRALAALAGNAGNVAALRTLFLAELPGVRDAVAAAAGDGDADAIRASLHRLRAGCGFVGAARLEAAAAKLRDAPSSDAALQAFLAVVQDTLPPS